ncbi:MAG TPA: helix-turn-helix domain-containing protein [Anaerolineales bacterium]|nr:helix-turn-helix domain-containing protein [Anaerolineales bacterium]
MRTTIRQDTIDTLHDLGFTEYEARVYLALLASQPATGYQVSVRAGIPRSMVYEALGRLEARGAVLRSSNRRSTLYSPVPPAALLDHVEADFRQRVSWLRTDLARHLHRGQDDRFWTGRGPELIRGLAAQLLDAASSELLVIMADPEVERYRVALDAACSRGLRVGAVLTGELEAPCGLYARHPRRESEIQQLDQLLLIVADSEQTLIADLRGEGSATLTTNSHMVHIARQFVWMELLTQRLNASGAPDPMAALPVREREFLESVASAWPAPVAQADRKATQLTKKANSKPTIRH